MPNSISFHSTSTHRSIESLQFVLPVVINKSIIPIVRIHSSCSSGDILGSLRCDCGEQLHKALKLIEQKGEGLLIYLNQEGRGIGLMDKMKAYKLQEQGVI